MVECGAPCLARPCTQQCAKPSSRVIAAADTKAHARLHAYARMFPASHHLREVGVDTHGRGDSEWHTREDSHKEGGNHRGNTSSGDEVALHGLLTGSELGVEETAVRASGGKGSRLQAMTRTHQTVREVKVASQAKEQAARSCDVALCIKVCTRRTEQSVAGSHVPPVSERIAELTCREGETSSVHQLSCTGTLASVSSAVG